MKPFKKAVDQSFFNQDAMYQRILESSTKKSIFTFKLIPSLAFALVIAVVMLNLPQKQTTLLGIQSPQNKLAYAVVSVDINPSFELFTDQTEKVIDVKALNAEAQTLDTQAWYSLPLPDVLDDLIAQATRLGYLNPSDTQTDYIVVSTVSYGADGQAITKTIQTRLAQNIELNRTVKTYVLNGNPDDYEEAEREHISVGLYLMNGLIQNQGQPMTIKEFVQDSNNLDQLEEIAEHQSADDLKPIVQALLDDLKSQGVDVSSFEKQLGETNVDLEELVDDLKDFYANDQDDHDDEKDDD